MNCRFNNTINACLNYVLKNRIDSVTSCVSANIAKKFQDIPTPAGLPIIGTTLGLIAAGSAPQLHAYVDKRHQQLGPIYKEKIGPVTAVFVSDPEYMRSVFNQEGKYPIHVLPEAWTLYNKLYGCSRGLFFMNGEEWLYHRRILNKLLLKGDTTWIENACKVVSKDLIARWEDLSKKHEIIPGLETQLYRWSIDVLVAVLLGHKNYQENKHVLNDILQRLASVVHLVFQTSSKLQLIPAALACKFKIPAWKNFVKSVDDTLLIANDLVVKLLDEIPQGDGLLSKLLEENLLRSDIIRIIADLVIAAGDTTAYSMEWMLYLTSKNKNIQEQLRAELKFSDNPPPLLKNVLRESLRMYPVAPFLTRIFPDDAQIGDFYIPAGTLIIMSIYTSARNEEFFENPTKFCPNRWLRGNSGNTQAMRQACLPFGFGTRSCIGKKIAEIQLQTTLADIIRNFDVTLRNSDDAKMVLKMISVPSQPIRLNIRKM